jgi:hypothetical protein
MGSLQPPVFGTLTQKLAISSYFSSVRYREMT